MKSLYHILVLKCDFGADTSLFRPADFLRNSIILMFAPWQTTWLICIIISRPTWRLLWIWSIDFVWGGWGVLHASRPAGNNTWRSTLGQTPIFSEPNQISSVIKGLKVPFGLYLEKPLTRPLLTAFVICFGVTVRFDWMKFDVWLKQAFFFKLFESTQTVIRLGSCEVRYLTQA